MLSWTDFAAEAPALEAFGRRRLERRIAYLATIRADGSPRVHPVSAFIVGGCLAVYMEPTSLKVADLRRDVRYALHCSPSSTRSTGRNGSQGSETGKEVALDDENAALAQPLLPGDSIIKGADTGFALCAADASQPTTNRKHSHSSDDGRATSPLAMMAMTGPSKAG